MTDWYAWALEQLASEIFKNKKILLLNAFMFIDCKLGAGEHLTW